jgi:AraC-like DNA-binding protein
MEGDYMRGLLHIGLMPRAIRRMASHVHGLWEIVYYVKGNGVVTVGECDIPFKPGTIVCLPPDIPHSEASLDGYKDYYFVVDSFYHLGNKIPVFQDNENGDFLKILMQMHHEYHKKQKNWNRLTESLLAVLIEYMTAWTEVRKKSPIVEVFENRLLSNISNPLFVLSDEIKKHTISESHLRKLYKEETGISPMQYLNQKRIEYAKELLSRKCINRYKIKEIANLCGYQDPYYFSRLFKKQTGVNPEDWCKIPV